MLIVGPVIVRPWLSGCDRFTMLSITTLNSDLASAVLERTDLAGACCRKWVVSI